MKEERGMYKCLFGKVGNVKDYKEHMHCKISWVGFLSNYEQGLRQKVMIL